MNVDAIFDAVSKASRFMLRYDAIETKKAQIADVASKSCGHCFHWMKASCIPEKKFGQFKSCNSYGCNDFARCPFSEQLIQKFNDELDELKAKIKDHP